MSLPIAEQFIGALERSTRPVIVLTEMADIDDFASAFAIAAVLEKMGKQPEIGTTGGRMPNHLAFLKKTFPVHGDFGAIRKMSITLKTSDAKIDELSYDDKDGELTINLIPKTGMWHEDDVKVSTSAYKYDLVITIGVRDLEQVGELYKQYPDFFFTTPIINIDHRSDNEHHGQINLVDINAVSTTEVCHDIFCSIDKSLLDDDMSTLLLTGMVFKTNSFKAMQVSPRTLQVASSLIESGADRDLIVQNLYKTKSVETLRLWGRALARLKSDNGLGLVWTMLTKKDFSAAGANIEALESIVDELISTSPQSKIVAIFYEVDDRVDVLLHAERPYDAIELGAAFSGVGTREQSILHVKEDDIVEVERRVISHLKEKLEQKLKIKK